MTAMLRSCFALFYMAALFFSAPVAAHEARPALIDITETVTNQYRVVMKQPQAQGRWLGLDVVLPGDCSTIGTEQRRATRDAVIFVRTMSCAKPLAGRDIRISGLEATLTDAFIRAHFENGTETNVIARRDSPSVKLEEGGETNYFALGVEHIATGWDHLLFVGLLYLIVGWGRRLMIAVSAFTVSHSVTLALLALGHIPPMPPVIEVLIALSVAFLGVELVYKLRGRETFVAKWPLLPVFCFGLLHGLGFGSFLSEVGLPPGERVWSLLLFNVGVEAGQIALILLLEIARRITQPLWIRGRERYSGFSVPSPTMAMAYAAGTIATYWTMERLIGLY